MLSKMRSGAAIAALLLVAACANTYNRIETGGTERINARLDESVAVLVTTPKDGGSGRKLYQGSGAVAARAIDAAFSRYARLVDVSPSDYHSLDDLKGAIAQNGYGYIVVPTIRTWSQKDSNWSKCPSQVSVRILIIDAATGKKISQDFLEAKGPPPSSLYDLFDSVEDGPEELLSELANDYADSLYGSIFALGH